MAEWVEAGAVVDIEPGACRVVDVDGVMVAVFNVDGEFHAVEDMCSHDDAELSTGCLIGAEIECPRHGARFDLKTGEALTPPAYEPIPVLQVRVVDGLVQVMDDRWD